MEARELSPGELTGSKLEGVVRLDKLAYADAFAERYTGRLLDSRRAVYVTVFNQMFTVDPGTTKRVETARALVGSPMPPQINTLLQTHFDKELPFLIESEPRGPSVRTLLDEKRSLPWADAVRITANLARAMQWLHEQGVPHCSFHPTSIFVTKLQAGHVVVGDWSLEAIFPPDSAERQLEEDPTAFAGYIDYMAPEIARGAESGDIRSAVYALGCVLYEMILGKVPLPGKSAAEVLKRHRHEKPVRLSIAVEGGDLPEQLDDILEMMLAKDPSKRFQSPAAAIAALSNLVDESADELAPPLDRASETDVDDLYRTIDMDSVDRAELERISEAEVPTQDLGQEAAQMREAKLAMGGAVSGSSATSDVDDTTPDQAKTGKKPRPSTGKYNTPTTADQDKTLEAMNIEAITKPSTPLVAPKESASKKTLMMGSLNAVMEEEELEEPDGRKKTLLHFNPGKTPSPAPADKKAPPKLSLKSPKPKAQPTPEVAAPESTPSDETIRVSVTPDAPTEVDKPTLVPGELDAAATLPPSDAAEKPGPATEPAADEKATISLDPEQAEAAGLTKGSPELDQFKNQRDQTREIDRSEWFSGNQDDVWESSLAREVEESSERTNRMIKLGLIAALVLGAIGVIAYFESIEEPTATPEEPTAVVEEPTEPEAPQVDVAAIRAAFDGSLSKQRLIEPIGNCAVTHLEELKRYAGEEPTFAEARDQFVEKARVAAKQADEDGDLRSARALAGYASQFAPDDEELAKMTAEFQARFTGVAADVGGSTDAGVADAGVPDMGAPEEAPEVAVVETPPTKPTATKPKKPKTSKKPKKPKKFTQKGSKGDTPSSEDAASLAKEARAAHSSGDLKRAKALYQSAISAAPKNATALAGLGKVYFDKANYREAIKYQTKAVRYAPKRNDYRIALGQSYYRLGKYSEAIGVWERVLARDPNNSTARQYVELAKRKLGR